MVPEHARRRTFAIISHPDAGKTTLTEKLLLFGGAIHAAGAVKSRKARRAAVSDWMEIEKRRGISVTSTVLSFEHEAIRYNLLDTPGHEDFSEDTYRTLVAADCAVMLIDAARGVEAQTRKLFHVCRARGTPIVTFVNKLDRPARDPFDLMREIEEVLGIPTVPRTWPVGSGDRFLGVYDRATRQVLRFERTEQDALRPPVQTSGLDDPRLDALLGEQAAHLREAVALLDGAGEPFDRDAFLAGRQTPVFFGSALRSFGVEPFLRAFRDLCPPPGPRHAGAHRVDPADPRFSGFVFKVQANMDPAHRDRVAFLRICSGRFESGMRVYHRRLGKEVRLGRAEQLFAQDRESIEQAWPGDIVGLFDPGLFRIGDTLSQFGPELAFDEVPRFSPERFARVRLRDPMRRKQFQKGIEELCEEGAVQLFVEPGSEKDPICGVVGPLQLEVLVFRLEHEYGARVELEPLDVTVARWVEGASGPAELLARRVPRAVLDLDGRPVALFHDEWEENRARRDNPGWTLHATAPMGPRPSVALPS